jgi:hypothetical protein
MPRGKNPNSLKNLQKRKPFVKGDPRINPGGRVRSFDQLRELLQDIANEEIKEDGKTITRLRSIILGMTSDKKLYKDFLEFGYGKVPLSQIVDITSGGKPLVWKEFVNNDNDDGSSNEDKSEKTGK